MQLSNELLVIFGVALVLVILVVFWFLRNIRATVIPAVAVGVSISSQPGLDAAPALFAALRAAVPSIPMVAAIVDNAMLNGQCIRLDAGQRFAPK